MKTYNLAILGGSGAVGYEMLKLLIDRNFPIKNLYLFASKKSAGKKITYKDKSYIIKELHNSSFKDIDIVLGAIDTKIMKFYLPAIMQDGAILIDNSSAFRMEKGIPLVIPEINPQDIYTHKGIISNPNCATIIALTALYPLHQYAHIKRMIVSTYQAVSGAGEKGINELKEQIQGSFAHQVFPYPIAFNLIPQIGDFELNDYTSEEMKMQNEGRKILHQNDLSISCTCVRVPVYRSHSLSIYVEFEKEIDVSTAKNLLADAKGVTLLADNTQYPMPLYSSEKDDVYVGRIRQDLKNKNHALHLWCCGDQLRKGAALNAVQIAELLIKNHV